MRRIVEANYRALIKSIEQASDPDIAIRQCQDPFVANDVRLVVWTTAYNLFACLISLAGYLRGFLERRVRQHHSPQRAKRLLDELTELEKSRLWSFVREFRNYIVHQALGPMRSSVRFEMNRQYPGQVETIHLLVATHPHADHIGGMSMVLQEFTVLLVADSGYDATSALWKDYRELLMTRAIPVIFPRRGDVIQLGNLEFEVLHPSDPVDQYANENNASIVIRLEYGDVSFLFTGDVVALGESEMLSELGSSAYELLDIDTLKVGPPWEQNELLRGFPERGDS